jgi:hypothetical protein
MDQALAIEGELDSRFYSQPRPSAQDYESFREEYYRDLAE